MADKRLNLSLKLDAVAMNEDGTVFAEIHLDTKNPGVPLSAFVQLQEALAGAGNAIVKVGKDHAAAKASSK